MPTGDGVDANAFDAAKQQIFCSHGDGTLTILQEETAEKFSVRQNAKTRRGARTMALNPSTHEVYLVRAEFDEAPPAEGQQRPRRRGQPFAPERTLALNPKISVWAILPDRKAERKLSSHALSGVSIVTRAGKAWFHRTRLVHSGATA